MPTFFRNVTAGVFDEMTPFRAGLVSSAVIAALIFIGRVFRILYQRMKRRIAFAQQRIDAQQKPQVGRRSQQGSSKKRK